MGYDPAADDTYRPVFAALDAEQFQNFFMDWIETVESLTEGPVIAADEKTLRRSHDRGEGKRAAWDDQNLLKVLTG